MEENKDICSADKEVIDIFQGVGIQQCSSKCENIGYPAKILPANKIFELEGSEDYRCGRKSLCESPHFNNCDQICTEIWEDYSVKCSCKKGYILALDEVSCWDLNECSSEENVCINGDCLNTIGSYETVK